MGPSSGLGCTRIRSLPPGTRWALEGGNPTPGPGSFLEAVGPQGASLPTPERRAACRGPGPMQADPAPPRNGMERPALTGTAAAVHGTAVTPRTAPWFGSLLLFLVGHRPHASQAPLPGTVPAPLRAALARVPTSRGLSGAQALLGLLLRFQLGSRPPVSFTQFYSVPSLPGLPASGLGRFRGHFFL